MTKCIRISVVFFCFLIFAGCQARVLEYAHVGDFSINETEGDDGGSETGR